MCREEGAVGRDCEKIGVHGGRSRMKILRVNWCVGRKELLQEFESALVCREEGAMGRV